LPQRQSAIRGAEKKPKKNGETRYEKVRREGNTVVDSWLVFSPLERTNRKKKEDAIG